MSEHSKIGFGEEMLPMPMGYRLGGFSRKERALGIHDPVYARAIYLKNRQEEVVIVSLDLVGMFLRHAWKIRKRISMETNMKIENIWLCCLHNHSGPDTMGVTDVDGLLYRRTLDLKLIDNIEERIVNCVKKAISNTFEGEIGFGRTVVTKTIALNRRNPRKKVDYPINVIKFVDKSKKLRGILVNYAAHATVLPASNLLYTADYPGVVVRKLKEKYGSDVHVQYLNGPSGDINPLLFERIEDAYGLTQDEILKKEGDWKKAENIGGEIAKCVEKTLDKVPTFPLTNIRSVAKRIFLPAIDTWRDDFKSKMQHIFYKVKILLFYWLYRTKMSNLMYLNFVKRRGLLGIETAFHIMQVNDIYIVGFPGEPFLELGKEIIEKIPNEKGFVVELVNDEIGYIFPIHEYFKGGYEMLFAVSPFSGALLKKAIVKNLNALKKS